MDETFVHQNTQEVYETLKPEESTLDIINNKLGQIRAFSPTTVLKSRSR